MPGRRLVARNYIFPFLSVCEDAYTSCGAEEAEVLIQSSSWHRGCKRGNYGNSQELSAAIAQNPPDAKMLQMVANVFLTDIALNENGKPIDKFQNKLRLCFHDFSKKCADALVLNKQLILPDQLAYQTELQKNYVEFTRKMAPIMGGTTRANDRKDLVTNAEHALAVAAEIGPVTSV
ncbi:dedicator of cytokinesis [Cooperia oncophora]